MSKLEVWLVSSFVGFFLGIFVETSHPGIFRDGSDIHTLYRGDKVSIHLPESHDAFYKNCQVIFIAAVSASEDNEAFVLLKNCDFMKNEGLPSDYTVTDIFPLRYLERTDK